MGHRILYDLIPLLHPGLIIQIVDNKLRSKLGMRDDSAIVQRIAGIFLILEVNTHISVDGKHIFLCQTSTPSSIETK